MGNFFRLFLIFVFATPPLFILGEVTERIDDYQNAGLGVFEVAYAYLFKIPQYVVFSFPVAALVASVFTIHGMTTHRELVAAKAGGVSFGRLVTPIVIAGVILTGVGLALGDMAPRGVAHATAILEQRTSGITTRRNFVYKNESGLSLEALTLTTEDGRIHGPILYRRSEDGSHELHVEAETAIWTEADGWTLLNGWHRTIGEDGRIATTHFMSLRFPELAERPEDLMDVPPNDEELTRAELDKLAGIIERSGGQAHKLRVRKEQKLAIPVATLVIILFGMPLATSSERGGAAFGAGVALGTTILYLVLLRVSGGFGSSGTIPPLWAAWLPNGAFLLAGLVLMTRVRT